MNPFSIRWVLPLALGCTSVQGPAQDEQRPAQQVGMDASEANGAFVPEWHLGQTWTVKSNSLWASGSSDTGFVPLLNLWRYEVTDISDDGIVTISLTRASRSSSKSASAEPGIKVLRSGMLMVAAERGGLYTSRLAVPLLPHIQARPSPFMHVMPFWPKFPLVPGDDLSVLGGSITQSVREVDGVFHIELFAKDPDNEFPWTRATIEWERGRPFWSKAEVFDQRGETPDLEPVLNRSEVTSWGDPPQAHP